MHTHAYSYAYMHICENTCTHIHMHAHTRTHTHTLCVCVFMKMAWVVNSESDLFVIGWIVYFFNITFMVDWTLTLFVSSNLEWVAFPSPSNIGVKMRKVGMGQEKPDTNAHISTVTIAVAITLWHNFTHLLPSLFRVKYPSIIRVINFMLTIIIHEKCISNVSEN